MQHKIVCFFTAQCMASDGIWGICFSLPIQVGALPQIGTKNNHCLKLDIQSCFHHLQHKKLCASCKFLTAQCMASCRVARNMPLTQYSSGGMTPDRYQNPLLSKDIHTIMFPSLAA